MHNEEGTIARMDKIAYIFWALINNNVASTTVYCFLLLLDYALLLLMVLAIYQEFKVLPFDVSQIAKAAQINSKDSLAITEECIIFGYLMLIVAFILILIFKQSKPQFYQEKTFFFKLFSLMMVLLRSVVGTLFILTLCSNLDHFESIDGTKYVQLALIAGSFLLLAIMQYLQAYFFNLVVPNTLIPWSETFHQPLVLNTLFKVTLSLAFNFRKTITLRYTFLVISIAILGYHLLIRIRKSFMFNKIVYFAMMLGDSILMHLLLIILPAYFFPRAFYSVIVCLTMPATLLLVNYCVQKYNIASIVYSNEDLGTMKQGKVMGFLQLLELHLSEIPRLKNYVQQVHYQHQLTCHSYFNRLDRKMHKHYNQIMNQADEQPEEASAYPETLIGDNTTLLSNYDYKKVMYQDPLDDRMKAGANTKFQDTMYSFQAQRSLEEVKTPYMGLQNDTTTNVFNINNTIQPSRQNLFGSLQKPRTMQAIGKKKQAAKKAMIMMDLGQIIQKTTINETNMINRRRMELRHKNQKRRQKSEKGLIKHFFKHHLMPDNSQDIKLQLLKIYYTVKVMGNPYLGHFLLFSFIHQINLENFIPRNLRILHQKYFESFLIVKEKEDTLQGMDLQSILDLNQYLALFETLLDKVADDVLKFWTALAMEKETYKLYEVGLRISDGIRNLKKVYELIEQKQGEKKEIKVYIQMSAFYKYVIFKNQECIIEIQKSRLAHATLRLARDNKEKDFASQKGLFIVEMNLKKPMIVNFANKTSCKMFGYDKKEMIAMKINQLMPQLVSEYHHKFIERFLATGKYSMLSQKMPNFIRLKNGYVKPVLTYLNVNHLNVRNMILIVQENDDFGLENDDHDEPYIQGIMLAGPKFQIYEITPQLQLVTGMSNEFLHNFRQQIGNDPYLDDFFMFQTQDLKAVIDQGICEFQVELKPNIINDLKVQFQEEMKMDEPSSLILFKRESKRDGYSSMAFRNHQHQSMNGFTFTVRIIPFNYMGGSLRMYAACVLKPQFATLTMHHHSHQNDYASLRTSMLIPGSPHNDGHKNGEGSNSGANFESVQKDQTIFSFKDDHIEGFDLSSHTSTSSGTSSTSMSQKFNQYHNSVNSSKIPRTLKFVLQLVIGVALLMLTTSTVALILTISNFNDAQDSILVSSLALQRLSDISTARVFVRALFNYAMGYIDNENSVVPDRFKAYGSILENVFESLRTDQNELDEKEIEFGNSLGQVELQFLTSNNQVEIQKRYLSQAIMVYVGYGSDLLEQIKFGGPSILKSDLGYLSLDNLSKRTATLIERQGFFLIENGNQHLYSFVEDYAQTYVEINKQEMGLKIEYQGTMTWISMAIIFLCCLIIIPLFGRIQNRVLYLMKLFMAINKERKQSMIERVNKFRGIMQHQREGHVIKTETDSKAGSKQLGVVVVHQRVEETPQKSSEHSPTFKKCHNYRLSHIQLEKPNKHSVVQKPVKGKQRSQHPEEEEKVDHSNQVDDQQDDDDLKKHKKKSLDEYQEEARIQQNVYISSDMLTFFKSYIKRQKLKQSLVIFILCSLFACYFIGTYFISRNDFEILTSSIDILFLLFFRSSCVENVIHGVTETLVFKNQSIYLHGGEDEIMQFYYDKCQTLEQDYQDKVRRDRPEYLADALGYIEWLESSDICTAIFTDNHHLSQSYEISIEKCQSYYNGIMQTGLTNVLQTAYKTANQIRLEFGKILEEQGNALNVKNQWVIERLHRLKPYLDIIEIIASPGLEKQHDKVLSSMESSISTQRLSFLLLYSFFLVFTFVVVLIFLLRVYRRLLKEMQLSNRLLYIIDFDTSPEEEKVAITNFLTKY